MKQDRLNIQYATLYEIILQRYSNVTPDSIKQKLINSEFDFEIENPIENTNKTLTIKKKEYINSEVSIALKKLSKSKKTDEELEDYDDTYYFDEEVSKEQKVDYKYYQHAIIIGVPTTTSSGKPSKRNAYYRLNKNIQFSTTDRHELEQASKFLYLQFTNNENALVDDDMVKYITAERKTIIEDDYKDFLVDTFVQITTHKDKIKNKKYSLHLLLTLVSLQAKVNIQVNSNNSIYNLNNIVIDSLVFNKDKFDIKCNGIQFTLSSVEDIKLIQSASANTIKRNIQETNKILHNYSESLQKYFKYFVDNFTSTYDIFFHNY
jgi:hypothetical protein